MAGFSISDPEKIAPLLAEGLKETNALIAEVGGEQAFRAGEVRCVVRAAGQAGTVPKSDRAGAEPFARSDGGSRPRGGPRKYLCAARGDFDFRGARGTVPGARAPEQSGRRGADAQSRMAGDSGGRIVEHHGGSRRAGEPWARARRSISASPYASRKTPRRRVPISRGPAKSCLTTTRSTKDTAIFRLLLIRLPAWVEFTYLGVPVRVGQVVQTVQQQTGQGVVLNPLVVTPAVSVRIFPEAGITPLGSKSFALSAQVHTEAPSRRERHGAARSAGRLAFRAGVGSLRAGARWTGTEREVRGHCRPLGDEALHGDGGGGVRRPAISRRLHHRGVRGPASLQSLCAGNLSNLRRGCEDLPGIARRIRDGHGRYGAAVARESRRARAIPERAGRGAAAICKSTT